MASYRYTRKRRRRRRRKRSNGMKLKHKNMLWGAGAITAIFVLFPSYYFALAEKLGRGGQS